MVVFVLKFVIISVCYNTWLKQVEALKQLSQQELIEFFNEHIKLGAPGKKGMSIRVYGSAHSSEQKTDKSRTAESNFVQIEDIFSFRRSRPLYGSFRGGFGQSSKIWNALSKNGKSWEIVIEMFNDIFQQYINISNRAIDIFNL